MWTIESTCEFLLRLRFEVGPAYGSEDLCMLLYSLVKREKPEIVVELGTGYGVTTAWIAAAMKENGRGRIVTVDNGSHFKETTRLKDFERASGKLSVLNGPAARGDYQEFLNAIFEAADVSEHVQVCTRDIDLENTSWLTEQLDGKKIDMLFSDFNHSPRSIRQLVGRFVPLLNTPASLFVDSASTSILAFLTFERLVGQLNRGQIPRTIAINLPESERVELARIVSSSTFTLMHLLERVDRNQNSTAWLRIEPVDLVPAPITTHYH